MAQMVNFHHKCIETAGLKWSHSRKKWAKWVTGFDLTKKNGFRYTGAFIKDIEYHNPPVIPIIVLCCSYINDIKAKYAIVVWDKDGLHKTNIRTSATQWAMDIFDKVNTLFERIEHGESWSDFIDTEPTPKDDESEDETKKEPAFGVIKITPQRKDLLDAIIELSSKCPGISLYSVLMLAIGDNINTKDIPDEELIDLVFDYTMQIAGESLTLD